MTNHVLYTILVFHIFAPFLWQFVHTMQPAFDNRRQITSFLTDGQTFVQRCKSLWSKHFTILVQDYQEIQRKSEISKISEFIDQNWRLFAQWKCIEGKFAQSR